MPPKTTSADYLRAWREYKARHGSLPVESPGSPGYRLAKRIRHARATGKFSAAELAELDAPPLPSATGPATKGNAAPLTSPPATGLPAAQAPPARRMSTASTCVKAAGKRGAASSAAAVRKKPEAGTGAGKSATLRGDSATGHGAGEGHLASAAERGSKTSQSVHPEAPSSKLARPTSESEAALAEPYFEAQEGAWCGLHALNNYLGGPYVRRDDCGLAAARVCTMLSQAGDGDAELPAWHLNPDTGWLSIDVINVLGSTLGLAVDGAAIALTKLLEEDEVACLLNWNNAHWTVLQQRSRHGPWVHTNSIEGHASFHGRGTLAGVLDLFRLMHAIQDQYGDATLHKIRRTDRSV